MDGGDGKNPSKYAFYACLGAFAPNKKPNKNLMDSKFAEYIVAEEIF